MEIKDIKDKAVRGLAYKRKKEAGGITNDMVDVECFDWRETPEGEDFWVDLSCGKDVTHYDCYPKKKINLMNLTKAELIADMEAIQEENAKLTKKLDITYRDLCKEKEEMKAEKKLNEKLVFDLADAENTIANRSGRLKAETEAHERTGERLCDCEAVAISTQNKLEAYQIVHRDQTNN